MAKAISYHDMASLFKKQPYKWFQLSHDPKKLKELAQNFDKVWIISIRGPDVPPLFGEAHHNLLELSFHDVFYDISEPTEDMKKACKANGYIYPDKSHANIIVEFIKKAQEAGDESNDLLLVNCMMGISRSGAVVDFAIDYCNLDRSSVLLLNKQIRPNASLLKLLKDRVVELSK